MSWYRCFAGIGLLAIMGGCVSTQSAAPVQAGLAPAQRADTIAALPEPARKDKLRYDRGSSLMVVAVEDHLITWRRGRHTTLIKPRNPFLPAVHFDNPKLTITSALDAPADALFPLVVGNEVSFTERRQVDYKEDGRRREFERAWHCRVADREVVEVPAGRFDSFKVRCENPASDAFFRVARAYEWHYAPAIGQIVKERYERFRKAPRHKQLVSLTTQRPIARGMAFETALQSTFETQPSDIPVAFGDPASGQQGEIEIRRTIKLADGIYCRDADIRVLTQGAPIADRLRACREPDGSWRPRLP